MKYVNDFLLHYGQVNSNDNYSLDDVNETLDRLTKTYDFNSIDRTISMLDEREYEMLLNEEYFHEFISNNKLKHYELTEFIDDFNMEM